MTYEGWRGRNLHSKQGFIIKEEQASRKDKAEDDEFRTERRRPYGRPVGRRAGSLVSAIPSSATPDCQIITHHI